MRPILPGSLGGLLLVLLLLMQGCASLPSLAGRPASSHLEPARDSRLGRAILPLTEAHPDQSGVIPLKRGLDAFAARVLLADAAERSLDVQYYIWHADLSGTLLIEALRRAAARGVRVRLLLDDANTSGLDEALAALAALPNVEVRLFNPFPGRGSRSLGYLFDFDRLNHRMHNKSFTVDDLASVVGGRNVGDEYFEAGSDVLFVDLDALAIGPVVGDVSRNFDQYWASDSAYPAQGIVAPIGAAASSTLVAAAAKVEQGAEAVQYRAALANSHLVGDLLANRLPFDWSTVRMVSDDPAKGLGRATDEQLLWTRLKSVTTPPTVAFRLLSPYFVPGEQGTAELAAMARRGVKVQILTNSLESTDVVPVHAGYAKRRKALLEAGVVLYEVKRESLEPAQTKVAGGSKGVSGSSLHAKTFSLDDKLIFIGSFNFDPRSARLNTEMGFVIDSPALAAQVAEAFAREVPDRAYRVRLTSDGNLEWVERVGGKEVVHQDEPGATMMKRVGILILSWLPIEWLL
jgi:cardiolipin synthase C